MSPKPDLEKLATELANESYVMGSALANHGDRVKRNYSVVRAVNVAVGVAVVTIVLVPQMSELVGQQGVRIASLVAALVLILDTVVPVIVGQTCAERFGDYAQYILDYGGTLKEVLADASMDPNEKRARLQEMVRLARKNLNDVKAKWPRLVKVSQNT